MTKIQIDLPASFAFTMAIPVRITDINYGGHVGNDKMLSFAHDARLAFLRSKGFTEQDFGGTGLIMRDAIIQFKKEIFYGDEVNASVAATEFSRTSFDLIYIFEKMVSGSKILLAVVKTGMVCFDYPNRKVVAIPEGVREKLTS